LIHFKESEQEVGKNESRRKEEGYYYPIIEDRED